MSQDRPDKTPQARTLRTDEAPQVLVLRTFHVDHATWERFGEQAQAQGSNRAAELRKLIDRSLEEEAA